MSGTIRVDEVDVPGRGAWTQAGGLLPVRPGTTKKGFYYRSPFPGETMIGRLTSLGGKEKFTYAVVREGVKVIQELVGAVPDGLLGDATGAKIAAMQKRLGLKVDALCGPATMRAMLTPVIIETANHFAVPVEILGGTCLYESGLDPAAVGSVGTDVGIAQINLASHDVLLADAVNPVYALAFAGNDLMETYERWAGKTKADPWDIAVANHNSPKSAQQWAKTGIPPFSIEREKKGYPQIDEYVRKARAAWSAS